MVLVKNWPFFQIFSYGNIVEENVFLDILERKNAFFGYKSKNFEKWKHCHFSKGVSPWSIFLFFFLAIKARKMCFSIFENEKTCFSAIKQEVQKVEKLPFFRE